jgi:hypothetical protein
VYLGTTAGQIIVMDVHGAMVSQVQLSNDVGITMMAWSCEKFKMEEGDETEHVVGQYTPPAGIFITDSFLLIPRIYSFHIGIFSVLQMPSETVLDYNEHFSQKMNKQTSSFVLCNTIASCSLCCIT